MVMRVLWFIVNVGTVLHMKEAVSVDHKRLVLFFLFIVLVQTTLITVQILRA